MTVAGCVVIVFKIANWDPIMIGGACSSDRLPFNANARWPLFRSHSHVVSDILCGFLTQLSSVLTSERIMESPQSPPIEVETASVEEMVSHLPGAQSLPDGFSVSENFPEVAPSRVSDSTERARDNAPEDLVIAGTIDSLLDSSTVELQETTTDALFGEKSELDFGASLKSSSEMLETNADYSSEQINGEEDLPVLTDFSMDSTADFATAVNKSLEKVRRFPVPLSGGEATPLVDVDGGSQRGPLLFGIDANNKVIPGNEDSVEGNAESATDSDGDDSDRPSSSQTSHLPMAILRRDPSTNDEPLQDMLELKIAELEVASTGSSKVDDEAAKRGKPNIAHYNVWYRQPPNLTFVPSCS